MPSRREQLQEKRGGTDGGNGKSRGAHDVLYMLRLFL